MKRVHIRRLRFWCVTVVTGIVAACSQASGRQTEQSQVCPRLPEASENGAELRLVACLLDDDVVPGNSVKVFVGLANDGEEPILTRARLDLGAYLLIRVEAEMGMQVETFVGEPGHCADRITQGCGSCTCRHGLSVLGDDHPGQPGIEVDWHNT